MKILLCITGGIAAYKSIYLLRLLQAEGCDVKVVLTPAATKFVTPTTLEALSGHPVGIDEANLSHIELANWADLVVIAPATANSIAKIATGFADNLLTSIVLATRSPILVFPAMNVNMYTNSATQANISTLQSRGFHVANTAHGKLACGVVAEGRLPEPSEMMDEIRSVIAKFPSLEYDGVKILVTAGPTIEPIDPVRYISNRSSGKMGYAIAQAAAKRGAQVTLISGEVAIEPPVKDVIRIQTAKEMSEAVLSNIAKNDILIMCAAVADYRVAIPAEQKIKKSDNSITLELVKNDDILKQAAEHKRPDQVYVGFAAESEEIERNALKKVADKQLDFIVANDISRKDIGFNVDENEITIYCNDGSSEHIDKQSKSAIAEIIVAKAITTRNKKLKK
jgi:phosphopantothenoylcysteine decarboxylase/phosphopantothenate--cysteine ligase